MKVLTKPFGLIDVDERQRVELPFGVFGFETHRNFVLLDAEQSPFYWLQSLESVKTAFVLVDPQLIRPDYTLDVDPEDLAEIGIQARADMLVFAIVTIPDDTAKKMTVNLQGPIAINRITKVGRQCINQGPQWTVRHRVMEEISAVRQGTC